MALDHQALDLAHALNGTLEDRPGNRRGLLAPAQTARLADRRTAALQRFGADSLLGHRTGVGSRPSRDATVALPPPGHPERSAGSRTPRRCSEGGGSVPTGFPVTAARPRASARARSCFACRSG